MEGVHNVEIKRPGKPSLWYVYAYRGGPQIHRHEGWVRPKLSNAVLRRLIAAVDARAETVTNQAATLGTLIALWRPNSPEWRGLSLNTRKTWNSALNVIEGRWGETALGAWNDPRMTAKVVEWRDSRSNTARAADMGVMVLRALLKFGRLRGKVAVNVAEGIPQLYRNAGRAEIVWTDEDIAKFATASSELGMEHVHDGLRLAALTGLRRADLVSLTWDEIRENTLVKKAAKTSRGKRRTVVLPRFETLNDLLEQIRMRPRAADVSTVLVTSFGKPWSGDGFGGSFNRVRDKADIHHIDPETGDRRTKTLHDVRGTFCTRLITAGQLSDHDAAQLMGWSPDQVASIRRTYVDQGLVNVALAARLQGAL